MTKQTSNPPTVAVIGAGPCGLVATKTLLEQGLDVTCYEMSSHIGGHWRINNPSGRSAAYQSLCLNTNKNMSRLSDFSMPQEWPELPSHAQVYEWWCQYADQFDLWSHIKLEHEVKQVHADGPHWQIGFGSAVTGEATGTVKADNLVLASGNFWQPNLPTPPPGYTGNHLHAMQYRGANNPVPTDEKSILVVGLGNTACEIALELGQSATKQVYLSARSGNWVLPKYIQTPKGPVHVARRNTMNHPLAEVPKLLRLLPEALREKMFNRMAVKGLKDNFTQHMQGLNELGLPAPPENPLSKRPAVADGLPEALQEGRLLARPVIQSASGQQITFTDGSTHAIDTIIYATGYKLTYPYMPSEILDTTNNDLVLFRGCIHPERHNLFVVGVSRPSGSFWPIAEAQSQLVANLVTGHYKLPSTDQIKKHTKPVLKRQTLNPALYGLSLREEIVRGARRAARS